MILSGDTDLIARSLWLFWAFYGVPRVTEGHRGVLGGSKTFQKQGAGDGCHRRFIQQAVFNPWRSLPTSAAEPLRPD